MAPTPPSLNIEIMCHMGFVLAAIIHHPCDNLTPLLKEVSGCAGSGRGVGDQEGEGGGAKGVMKVAAKGRRRRYTNEGANAD